MAVSSWPTTASWRSLNRVGGVSALLFVLFGVAALVLYTASPPPVSGGAATLRFIAENKASYVAQQLLWLVPSLSALIVFTALLVAVLPRSPVLAERGHTVPAIYAIHGPMLWLWFAIIGIVLLRSPRALTGTNEHEGRRAPNLHGSVVIDRPIADVFTFIADQRNEPLYNPRMRTVGKATPGPIGDGTRWRIGTVSGTRVTRFELEITDFDPPQRLGSHTGMSMMDIDGELTLTPTPEGTRLAWSWNLTPKGLLELAASTRA